MKPSVGFPAKPPREGSRPDGAGAAQRAWMRCARRRQRPHAWAFALQQEKGFCKQSPEPEPGGGAVSPLRSRAPVHWRHPGLLEGTAGRAEQVSRGTGIRALAGGRSPRPELSPPLCGSWFSGASSGAPGVSGAECPVVWGRCRPL